MIRQAGFCLATIAWLTGCTFLVPVKSTEEYDVADCAYVGTFEEISNPGQVSAGTLKHYLDTTMVEYRVKKRAYSAGATHLVWLYNHSESAGALAYNCHEEGPPHSVRISDRDVDAVDRP
ncbi:MAG: hypothetical protein JJV98_16840 [Desulfosarcina sp.]|nr:hypothetical protein [Desulfobacterales bacterium]